MDTLRVIMIGDVVGEPGLAALEARLPGLIQENAADLVVVNGENAADGFGMTYANLARILAAGADVVTSGNHVWEKREFWDALVGEERILRPANYPPDTLGRGWIRLEKEPRPGGGEPVSWLIINLQGRELMTAIDCPFRAFDAILANQYGPVSDMHPLLAANGNGPVPAIFPLVLVDFHAESSREKEALGYYLNGRASLVAGTHTHVQTADERILSRGTGYITDLGMTGPADSVIGMDPQICLDRARTQVAYRMDVAAGPAAIQGVCAELDKKTGKTLAIRRIQDSPGASQG